MDKDKKRARRQFLRSIAVSPAACCFPATSPHAAGATPIGSETGVTRTPLRIPLETVAAGDDAIAFRKHTIDLGPSECVTVADMNGDGRLDIVSGESWYEQLDSRVDGKLGFIKHKFRDLPYTEFYLEDLSDLVVDVNSDGYPDVVSCSYWSKPLTWWENPGAGGGPWREHVIETRSPVEFAFMVDLLNTGKPQQILPQFGDPHFPLTWYEVGGKGSREPLIAHQASSRSYGHGIGAGDVNGDGRTDIITPKGWLEAPSDPRTPDWKFHPEFELGDTGFIHVVDINGDGVPDLLTSLGHHYGIFWYEQKRDGAGNRSWVKHLVDDGWSQAHATTVVDLNGDGRPELLTGKRYYAHEKDPGANEPLGVYWYEAFQGERGLEWRRHIIDYSTRTGAGLQIPVIDIDNDGDLDIVVAGKSGLYLFENLTASP